MEEAIIWLEEEHLAGEEHLSSGLRSPCSTAVQHRKHLEMVADRCRQRWRKKQQNALKMREHKMESGGKTNSTKP